MSEGNYVLITPARNEAKYIGGVLRSVVCQTLHPRRWIIVSDGSTDETDSIVENTARAYPFITLLRRDANGARDFTSKVAAFNAGYAAVNDLNFAYIGNLDADVTFEPDYFERLLEIFDKDPSLGVAGGAICEKRNRHFAPRSENRSRSVAGAVQMFRRKCFENIRGFAPLRYGGEDTVATVRARMHGWTTAEISSLLVYHHRIASTALGGGLCRARVREGQRDYSLGIHPLYALCKSARRLGYKPLVLGSLLTLAGYTWAAARGNAVEVPADVRQYMREEELQRLWKAAENVFSGAISRMPSEWPGRFV